MTLLQQCLELPYDERVRLVHHIVDSLQVKPVFDVHYCNRAGELLCILENLYGEKLSFDRRTKRCATAKAMIAYQMSVNEGHTLQDTGRQMGLDHSSIIYLRDNWGSILAVPYAYKEEIYIWKQLQKHLQNETDN